MQRDDTSLGQLETAAGERCALAAAQRGSDGNVDGFGGSVGIRDYRWRATGEGDGAAEGQRVVHAVEAAGRQRLGPHGVAGRQVGAFGGESGHGVVETGEEFVGFQVEGGEGVDGGAQLAHRHGGVDARAGDAADGEGDPGAGERKQVEPAPSGIGRLVEMGALDRCLRLRALGQETALQGQGDGVFPRVAACVVDVQRRARGDPHGEVEVFVHERVAVRKAKQAQRPQYTVPQGQRGDDRGKWACRAGVPQRPRIGVGGVVRVVCDQMGPQVGQGLEPCGRKAERAGTGA